MNRVSIKVTGAQGQGINSVGEICAKGLKRAGYCVFGYREYMSLIKGGHSSFQLDVSDEKIMSTETKVDILITFNHHGLEKNALEVKPGGIILHQTPMWKFPEDVQKTLDKRKVTVLYLPNEDILKKLKAKPILGNILITSVVWAFLKQPKEALRGLVEEQFGHKKDLLQLNFQCIDEGFAYKEEHAVDTHVALPKPNSKWSDHLLITGSQAMGLGTIHAGVRFFAGYPMTPASPLLSFIAEMQNETGIAIKQAEDEITAAQMVSGAMHMGTRALTGTSGGGFDLMSETLSLNGIIENPSVFVLAQRPGPATGLPTWTAQGDLLMAIGTSHGEFPRCVLSVSNSCDAFYLMNQAFNIAEEFQISVIVLTDKQVAEALYTQEPYEQNETVIGRGSRLVTKPDDLAKLKASDRYDPKAKDGISKRWLPGAKAATYCAQGDEHDGAGNVNETAENAVLQMEKRMRKQAALKKFLPDPSAWMLKDGAWQPIKDGTALDALIVCWGSTTPSVLMALKEPEFKKKKIGVLHYEYVWPLKTEKLEKISKKAKKVILVEQNHNGQLGTLIRQECGMEMDKKILKYDGRPFFHDELISLLQTSLKK
jgi:2-oxoglutarate ferredoxin oxidoreductase subunit alpha